MKLLIVAAVLYGAGWYASRNLGYQETLVWAKNHPGSQWAPAADYYVGLVYYQKAEYPKAQEAFTQLLTDYATGPYVAKGLLRQASAAEENLDWPVARQSLERFIEEFPDHKERRVAEQNLDMIKFK
jgi:TolA-binding protein